MKYKKRNISTCKLPSQNAFKDVVSYVALYQNALKLHAKVFCKTKMGFDEIHNSKFFKGSLKNFLVSKQSYVYI